MLERSLSRQVPVLKKMWRWAEAYYELPANVFDNLNVSKKRGKRDRRLTDNEYRLLTKDNTLISDITVFAVETAMRRQEIALASIDNLRNEGAWLHIPKTKTGEKRTIPLSELALSIVSKYAKGRTEGALFDVKPHTITRLFVSLNKKHNITDLHFHDLRHEALSRMDETGLSIGELRLMSGHASLSALSIYIHGQLKCVEAKIRGRQRLEETDADKKKPQLCRG